MNWTRDELLLALNLYFQTPFGKQHKGYPPIIKLATKIGRTPSAVAMKLGNFTSLDPAEQERGISGLSGASNADRAIWNEFELNLPDLAAESEKLVDPQIAPNRSDELDKVPDISEPTGPSEGQRIQKVRLQQRFFRRVVLASYEGRCCVSGLPIPQLLRASHIVPWSLDEKNRLNPRNGLCLTATFDAAFDRGLISISENFTLLLSDRLKDYASDSEVESAFYSRAGLQITLPAKNLPSQHLLQRHRESWGFPP